MTQKEKAMELCQKFGYTTLFAKDCNDGMTLPITISKKCALIAVEETIRTLNEDIRDLDVRGSVLLDLIEYWQEVKQEIEKL